MSSINGQYLEVLRIIENLNSPSVMDVLTRFNSGKNWFSRKWKWTFESMVYSMRREGLIILSQFPGEGEPILCLQITSKGLEVLKSK